MKKNTTIVVNAFGGPGTGKSTLATKVFSELKMKNIDCELVTEFAKDKTWEQNEVALEDQFYISGNQYHREYVLLRENVDVIITDSPIILGVLYNNHMSFGNCKKMFNDFLLEAFKDTSLRKNKNYFIRRQKPYKEKGRNQKEEHARFIDTEILTLLNENNITYDTVTCSENGANKIVQDILLDLS